MSTTEQRTAATNPATTAPQSEHSDSRRSGRKLAALVAGLTLLTAGSVTTWVALSDSSSKSTQSTVSPANQPGGSVYNEQVPDYMDWSVGYGPGSQLYSEQVPAYIDWSIGYGPNSTLYQEQVPAAARR